MFRDAISRLSLRKKLAILVSVGVLLPVLILTYWQYRSLTELENKTKGAFKDNLRQGLTIVEQQMKQRLEGIAAQTLDPIAGMQLPTEAAPEFEKYSADVKRVHPEVEDIFVFSYPATREETNAKPEILSSFDKSRLAQSFVDNNRKYLFEGNYLFYPLPNATNARPSVAGVLLKNNFVRDDLIAGTIDKTTSKYHGNTASFDLALTIRDENNQILYSNAPDQNAYLFETNFNRPFANWKAGVALKNTNLEDLARNSFLHSVGATLLVLVVLLCGIALIVRATDREARLAQAKANFVANVSHELKTPLSLLSLFSEILELGRVQSEEKKMEYYQVMRHESRRLNKVIDNILDFSKIEAGRKTYNFADGDMAAVVENVLSSYRYQIVNSGFQVETKTQPDLPPVSIDRDAMAQAISNLLDNAIKYSRDVKQLSITTDRRGPDVSVEIADRGIGIPRAEQAKIFEKFYRVGNGLVHDVKGSGLGLSLVKHIVEAHKGTVSVESEVGKGSRFTILLPVARSAANGTSS